jgi:hypothetical protein
VHDGAGLGANVYPRRVESIIEVMARMLAKFIARHWVTLLLGLGLALMLAIGVGGLKPPPAKQPAANEGTAWRSLIILFLPMVLFAVYLPARRFIRLRSMYCVILLSGLGLVAMVVIGSWEESLAMQIFPLIGMVLIFLSPRFISSSSRSISEIHDGFLKKYNPDLVLHFPRLVYPVWQLRELGPTIRSSIERATANIAAVEPRSNSQQEIAVLTEKISVEALSAARWRLQVYLSVFNTSPLPIDVHDVHTHVYFNCRMTMPPPASIWEWRSRIWIELKEDNSILTSGLVYPIAPNDLQPFEITLEISRLEEKPIGLASGGLRPRYRDERIEEFKEEDAVESKGFMLTVFGLFVDYTARRSERMGRFRAPSDSIFVFDDYFGYFFDYYRRGAPDLRHPDGTFKPPDWVMSLQGTNGGHATHVNTANLGQLQEKEGANAYGDMRVRLFQRVLQEHLARSFTLNS